ncbi:MAG: hypothetical protein WD995_12855 [Gemmatimonadota bacterium]
MADFVFPLTPVLLGLVGLWIGTAIAIRGALRMRGREASWEVIVGLTVLGLATALPEMGIAALGAGWEADPSAVSGLIVGTAVGSVLARSTLVLGSAALMGATAPDKPRNGSRPPVVLGAIALLALLAIDGTLGVVDGVVLVVAWATYNTLRVRAAYARSKGSEGQYGLLPDAFLVVLGILIVATTAWFVVPRGLSLAEGWGTDPLLVGLLVLGVGASLPELVFALSAATRGHATLSADSVLAAGPVGVLLPLGLAALIAPLAVATDTLRIDLPGLAVAVLALWLWGRRRSEVTTGMAAALLLYYMAFALLRMWVG